MEQNAEVLQSTGQINPEQLEALSLFWPKPVFQRNRDGAVEDPDSLNGAVELKYRRIIPKIQIRGTQSIVRIILI